MARHRKRGRHSNPGRHRKPGGSGPSLRPTVVGVAAATVVVVGMPAWPAAAAVPVVDWGPIIACESGGDPGATNPDSTASGLYQFLDSTWASLGGTAYSPRAEGATPAQQLVIANRAYAQSGFTPWAASRACWAGRSGSTATAPNARRGAHESSSPARPAGRSVPPAHVRVAPDGRAQVATAFALARVGSPDLPSWSGGASGRTGAGSEGWGLTVDAYAAAGMTLPATAAIQYARGPRLRAGTALLPGDLVFYGTPSAVRHTGIYVGDGNVVRAAAPDQLVQKTAYRWPGDDYLGAVRPTTVRSAPRHAVSVVDVRSPAMATARPARPARPPVGFVVPRPPAAVPSSPPLDPERSPAECVGVPAKHPAADSATHDRAAVTTSAAAELLITPRDDGHVAVGSALHPAPASGVHPLAGWVTSREPLPPAVVLPSVGTPRVGHHTEAPAWPVRAAVAMQVDRGDIGSAGVVQVAGHPAGG